MVLVVNRKMVNFSRNQLRVFVSSIFFFTWSNDIVPVYEIQMLQKVQQLYKCNKYKLCKTIARGDIRLILTITSSFIRAITLCAVFVMICVDEEHALLCYLTQSCLRSKVYRPTPERYILLIFIYLTRNRLTCIFIIKTQNSSSLESGYFKY